MQKLVRKLVIVGGGTAGWMAAALLARTLGTQIYTITLVESEAIGTVGVGEATIPPIQTFNEVLGLDEDDFIRSTNATFKLGIEFVNWRDVGHRYFHPFGAYGVDMDGIGFNAFWLRMAAASGNADFGRFNAETMAARENRFGRTGRQDGSQLPPINYAFQFDAALYAAYLRRYSEKLGVRRLEGLIGRVRQHPESGFVEAVETADGRVVEGDLFIDCSGFRGLLIEETLKSGYEDWSRWLPCNRAAAVPSQNPEGVITPFTRSTAQEAGWQWRIPLQHRVGNGYVFCDAFLPEEEACRLIVDRLDGPATKDPKILRFVTGHRKKIWNRNVVALGLASGFLEPLESTSIHLVQYCLTRFIAVMPRDEFNPAVIDAYNRRVTNEYNLVKDFLIAHYKITERSDTPFWQHCRNMPIPDSLEERLEVFRNQGHADVSPTELFREASWFAVLLGQGLRTRSYNPVADVISNDELRLRLSRLRTNISDRVAGLPSHSDFIARHCAAERREMPA